MSFVIQWDPNGYTILSHNVYIYYASWTTLNNIERVAISPIQNRFKYMPSKINDVVTVCIGAVSQLVLV